MGFEEVGLVDRTAFALRGEESPLPADSFSRLAGVERVISLQPKTPLASSTWREGGRQVAVGTARFGGGVFGIIAGPCTIEDPAMLRRIARTVKSAGAHALRGGAFKVRTSPHAFQGGGVDAFRALVETAREVDMPFFTELTDPRQVEQVGELIDGVQIGARHMQNFPLLLEAARLGKPILLKRHFGATAEEWLLSAEYILGAGNDQVMLCERGVRTAEKHVRFMLDLAVVPWLKSRTGLPVVVDPSHAAGHHALVPALGRAAIAAGADGLIVEVHPEPEATQCDAAQALPPQKLADLVSFARLVVEADGRRMSDLPERDIKPLDTAVGL